MKDRLVELIVCPACQGDLSLTVGRRQGEEVIEGDLRCRRCSAVFPVHGAVPRLVMSGGYASSFGFQWNRFRTVQMDSVRGESASERDLTAKTGLHAEDAKGRLILDAGVGAARYAEVMSRWGAELVGIDLTNAVDAAYANIGTRPRVHLVQADIFALPFRDDAFDIVYSIGVLHHTPSPTDAFRALSRKVRKGGAMAVYVYPALGVGRHFSDTLRLVTTRLPKPLLFRLAWAAVPLYHAYRLPVLGRVFQTVLPISQHPDPQWRWLDTFDWYSPRFQFKHTFFEVYEWFHRAGYTDVQIFREPICMRGVRTRDPVPP